MYYYNKYIGDMPKIILRGNMNYTSVVYIANLLNKINNELFNIDIGIKIEKVEGKFKYPKKYEFARYSGYKEVKDKKTGMVVKRFSNNLYKEFIEYPKGAYLIYDNIGECVKQFNKEMIGHIPNSIWTKDIWHIHLAMRDIFYATQKKLKILLETKPSEKVQLYYNQLEFISDWVGAHSMGDDYMGEISYDDGTIWVHPDSVGSEKFLKSHR